MKIIQLFRYEFARYIAIYGAIITGIGDATVRAFIKNGNATILKIKGQLT